MSGGPMDTWTVHASSGEYPVPAESAGHAFAQFTDRHPDDFVHAIDGMHLTLDEHAFVLLCGAIAINNPSMPLHEVEKTAMTLAADRGIAYTALCVECGSEPQETLTAKVAAHTR